MAIADDITDWTTVWNNITDNQGLHRSTGELFATISHSIITI
jgi:hypothetical protein